jgi:hypothetical protein
MDERCFSARVPFVRALRARCFGLRAETEVRLELVRRRSTWRGGFCGIIVNTGKRLARWLHSPPADG